MILRFIVCFIIVFSSAVHAGFDTYFVKHADGSKIRVGVFKTQKKHTKTVVICPGRASFIEKNEIAATEFDKLGFNVYVIDWRGHGGSDRLIQHAQKVFIQSYDQYVDDIKKTIESIPSSKRKNICLYGGSMGGHIVVRFLEKHPEQKIKAAILIAPMFDVKTQPFPKFIAKAIAWVKTKMGCDGSYCYGFGNFNPKRDIFEKNKNTHNKDVFEKQKKVTTDHPQFITGGPTFGWLYSTFESIDEVNNCKALKGIKTPIFIAYADQDRFVDNSNVENIEKCLQKVDTKLYHNSYHHIMHETVDIQQKLVQDIKNFLNKQGL
jgi:lysophospholipase